jgi:hypothetical protein
MDDYRMEINATVMFTVRAATLEEAQTKAKAIRKEFLDGQDLPWDMLANGTTLCNQPGDTQLQAVLYLNHEDIDAEIADVYQNATPSDH